jgi:hypothetical protein
MLVLPEGFLSGKGESLALPGTDSNPALWQRSGPANWRDAVPQSISLWYDDGVTTRSSVAR